MESLTTQQTTPLEKVTDLGEALITKLHEANITTVEQLADMTPEQLEELPGVGPKTVEKISIAVNNYFSSLEASSGGAIPEAGETAAVEGGEAAAEVTPSEVPPSEYSEAVETGQASEASAIAGVENAPDPDVAEVHVHGEDQPEEAAGAGASGQEQEEEKSEEEPS